MSGIVLSQPGGVGTVNAAGAATPPRQEVYIGTQCYPTFTGATTTWTWSMTAKPAGSTVSFSSPTGVRPVSTPNLRAPYFTPELPGNYTVHFVDSSANTFDLTIGVQGVVGHQPVSVTAFLARGNGIADDSAAIQAAINALPATGGELYFPSGTQYVLLTELVLTGKDKITFYSDGAGARILLGRNVGFAGVSFVTGFRMRGLTIVGTLQTDGGDPGGIPSNIIQGRLVLTSTKDVDISECRWEDVGGYAIFIASSTVNTRIHHNDFIRTQAGVQTGSGVGVTNVNIDISDNYFLGNVWAAAATNKTVGSDDSIAIFSGTSGKVRISGNLIDRQGLIGRDGVANDASTNQARAIDILVNPAANLLDVEVVDNIVLNCISTSTNFARPAIEVFGDPTPGGLLQSLIVSRNVVRWSNQGIAIVGPNITNLQVQDNSISDVTVLVGHSETLTEGNGITVSGGTGTIAGCVISGNAVARAGAYGISLVQISKTVVSHNSVTDSVGRGIQSNGCSDVTLLGNFISGGGYGLSLADHARHMVIGNIVSGASSYGCLFQGTNVSATFIGNIFTGSGTGAVQDVSVTPTHRWLSNDDVALTVVGNNRGQATITNATTATVTFPKAEANANYLVHLTVSDQTAGFAAGSTRAYASGRGTTGFTVNLEVNPGIGKTITIDWSIYR